MEMRNMKGCCVSSHSGAATTAGNVFGAGASLASKSVLEPLPTTGTILFCPHPPIPLKIAAGFLKYLFEDDEADEEDGEDDEIKIPDTKQYGAEGKAR